MRDAFRENENAAGLIAGRKLKIDAR